MVYGLLLFIHIVVSIVLIVSVLLQSSKGGGLAGTFGGSGMTGGIFGGRGAAPFLIKTTTVCAILFMVTSVTLNFVSSKSTPQSALERIETEAGGFGSEPAVTTEMPIASEAAVGGEDQGAAATESDAGDDATEQSDDNK